MKNIIIFLFALILAGCGVTRQLEIKPIVIKPPVITDSLDAEWVNSFFAGVKINGKDTIETVKFIPDTLLKKKVIELLRENKALGLSIKSMGIFQFKIKPDSIIMMDTVVVSKPVIVQTSLFTKIGIVAFGIIIGLIIGKLWITK